MKLTLKNIDWFNRRGFLFGRDKARDVYYIDSPGTGKVEFGSVDACKMFVERHIYYAIHGKAIEQ